jgi:hypothetical protein
VRQPHDLLPSQKSYSEHRPFRLFGSPRTIRRGFDLQKRQPRVIKKDPSGCRKRDAARLALQQLHADFCFQIANLPAQRWLRGVQSSLGSGQQAALLGNRNKVSQMAEFHRVPRYACKA